MLLMTVFRAALFVRTVASFESSALVRTRSPFQLRAARQKHLLGQLERSSRTLMSAADTKDADTDAIVLPNNDDNEQLLRIRHSTAHVMAMAVQKLFKGTKVAIGPWIEKGFYYDFDPPEPFKDNDLRRIKKEMDKIIQLKLPFTEEVVTREEAERRIKEQGEPYKASGGGDSNPAAPCRTGASCGGWSGGGGPACAPCRTGALHRTAAITH